MQTLQSGNRVMSSWRCYGETDSLHCRIRSRDCSEIQSQQHLQPPTAPESGNSTGHLFMQEDDAASWLYYLLDDPFADRGLAGVPTGSPPSSASAAAREVLPADWSPDPQSNKLYNHHQTTVQSNQQHYNHYQTTPRSNQHYDYRQATPQRNQHYNHHQTTPQHYNYHQATTPVDRHYYHYQTTPQSQRCDQYQTTPQSNQHYIHHQMTPQSQLLVPPVTVGANFKDFARSRARVPESGSSARSRNNELRESAVVDSGDAPAAQPWLSPLSGNAVVVSSGGTSTAGGGGCMSLSNDADTCEVTLTSFSGGSGATATEDPVNQLTAGDKKRKGKEITNEAISRYQNEDMKIDYSDSKKESGGPAAKRSRAAEVRNLSVRRRRNRINEKMRALQELIPRCNKTDKASMLDEAIEYFKSLQMQVQMMMSMGCGMLPVMFLGAQQYMPPMEIGINQPTTPFSAVLPGSGLPTAGEPSLYDPKFHLTNSSTPNVPAPDPSRILQTMDELNSSRTPPASTDPYLQYQTDLQMPLHIPQDQPNYIRGTDMK